MKKTRHKAVVWKAAASEDIIYELPEAIWRSILSVVGMMMCVFTTLFMMDAIWPGIAFETKGFFWILVEVLFCALGFEVLLPFLNHLQMGVNRTVSRVFVSILALAGVIWIAVQYAKDNLEKLLQGAISFGSNFLYYFNLHYAANINISAADSGRASFFLAAVISLIIFVLWDMAYLLRRKNVWLGLPLFIWLGEMIVGVAPGWKGIGWFCITYIFVDSISEMTGFVGSPVTTPSGKREYAKSKLTRGFLTMGITLVVFASVSLFGRNASTKLVEKAPSFKSMELRLEQKMRDIVAGGVNVDISFGSKPLKTKQQEYTGEPVLSLTISGWPTADMYLKKFQASDYAGGTWRQEDDTFKKKCREDGIDAAKLQRMLASCGYEKADASRKGEAEIDYKVLVGNNALVPYSTDASTWSAAALLGDVVLKKKIFSGKLSFRTVWGNVAQIDLPGRFYEGDEEEEVLWEWYSDYVSQHYLKPSQEIPAAAKIANQIGHAQAGGSDSQINSNRMYLAERTAGVLKQYRYELDMGQVPDGEDIIEYFLTEGQKGFCVHFATAGVQILRNMGIPARYCEGYYVEDSTFTTAETGGRYTSVVKDDRAHAWAEIYLEHVGWVPVEMTPGYSAGIDITYPTVILPSTDSVVTPPESSEAIEETQPEENQSEAQESSEPEETQPENDPLDSSSAGDNSEDEGPSQSTGQEAGGNLGGGTSDTGNPGEPSGGISKPETVIKVDGSGGDNYEGYILNPDTKTPVTYYIKRVLMILLRITAAVIVVAALGIFGYRFIRHKITAYREKVPRAIKNKKYKTAVLLMNQRFYKRLNREKLIPKAHLTDREYLDILKTRYCATKESVWDAYMETVKLAAYSDQAITKEQVLACYSLYEAHLTAKDEKPAGTESASENAAGK